VSTPPWDMRDLYAHIGELTVENRYLRELAAKQREALAEFQQDTAGAEAPAVSCRATKGIA
jgi:hypothetical protein